MVTMNGGCILEFTDCHFNYQSNFVYIAYPEISLFGLTASPFRIVNLFIWKRLTICVEKVRGDGNWEFGAKIVSSRRWSSFIVMLGYVSDV